MRVTLAQLEAFAWVARVGSVRQASRQLNLAQPTISLRLRDLERALGTPVFERSGRGLRLSAEGVGILEHANRILDEVGKIRGRGGTDEIAGLVRLGVSETFAVAGLPFLLKMLSAEQPALRIELVIGPSPDLVDDLCDRRVDLVVVVNPIDDTRLRIIPLGVQSSTWAAAPAMALPPIVKPADLRHRTVLANPSPSPNYRQTMAWFGAAGVEPLHLSLCNTVPSVIAHLVEAGVGIGILPTRLVEPQLTAGSLVALQCRPSIDKAILCAVYRASDREPALDVILGAARRTLERLDLLEPV